MSRKYGPIYDPRSLSEPVATLAQLSEIERLRKHLALIPYKGKTMRSAREGERLPNTSREADRLIGVLWRFIGRRLDALPESERSRFRIHRQLMERRKAVRVASLA